MILRLCIVAVLASLTGQAAVAEIATPQVGEAVSNRVLFLNGTVLLPPGQWIVAASEVQHTAEIDGSDVASVVLLQADSGRVGAVVVAQGNTVPLKSRPSLSSECWSEKALFTAVAADDDSGGACAAILPVATQLTAGGGTAWDNALAFAAAHGWQVPHGFMVASFRSVDRTRLMDVRYALAVPDKVVADSGAPCGWAVSEPEPSADVTRMVQGMTNFAGAVLAVLETAGHSALPEVGSAPPLLTTAEAQNDLLQRLKQARIDELVEQGALSPTQASALSRRAAEPMPGDPLIKELLWRSGYKTLTYKAATYIDTSVVYYIFVPDLPLVLMGSAITNVLGMPIVYINDFVWSYFGLKASRSKQPFAFASLGSVCPKR